MSRFSDALYIIRSWQFHRTKVIIQVLIFTGYPTLFLSTHRANVKICFRMFGASTLVFVFETFRFLQVDLLGCIPKVILIIFWREKMLFEVSAKSVTQIKFSCKSIREGTCHAEKI